MGIIPFQEDKIDNDDLYQFKLLERVYGVLSDELEKHKLENNLLGLVLLICSAKLFRFCVSCNRKLTFYLRLIESIISNIIYYLGLFVSIIFGIISLVKSIYGTNLQIFSKWKSATSIIMGIKKKLKYFL